MSQVPGRYVDRHAQVIAPSGEVHCRSSDDPLGDTVDEAGLLGEWNEAIGGQETQFWVLPPDERFNRVDAATLEADFRLVVEHELVRIDCMAKLRDQCQVGGVIVVLRWVVADDT